MPWPSKRAAGSYYSETLFGPRTRWLVRLLARELAKVGAKAMSVKPEKEAEAAKATALMEKLPAPGKVAEQAEHAASGVATAVAIVRRNPRLASSILVLDRARFPRDKPCGGGLTGTTANTTPGLATGACKDGDFKQPFSGTINSQPVWWVETGTSDSARTRTDSQKPIRRSVSSAQTLAANISAVGVTPSSPDLTRGDSMDSSRTRCFRQKGKTRFPRITREDGSLNARRKRLSTG